MGPKYRHEGPSSIFASSSDPMKTPEMLTETTCVNANRLNAATTANELTALLSLPAETRNQIYEYLAYDMAGRRHSSGVHEVNMCFTGSFSKSTYAFLGSKQLWKKQWITFGHVCRQIRKEYRTLQQSQLMVDLYVQQTVQYLEVFAPSKDAKVCVPYEGHIRLSFLRDLEADIDLLALFACLRQSPKVQFHFSFQSSSFVSFISHNDTMKALFDQQNSLRAYITSFDEDSCPLAKLRLIHRRFALWTECDFEVLFKSDLREEILDNTRSISYKTGQSVGSKKKEKGEKKKKADRVKQEVKNKFMKESGLERIRSSFQAIRFEIEEEHV